jgi:hypothetical protein
LERWSEVPTPHAAAYLMNQYFRDALSAASNNNLLSSALIYRRLPSANDKCLLNSFLNVGDKLFVA